MFTDTLSVMRSIPTCVCFRYWWLGVKRSHRDGSIEDPGCLFVETSRSMGAMGGGGGQEGNMGGGGGQEGGTDDKRWRGGGGRIGEGAQTWGAYTTGVTSLSVMCIISLMCGKMSPGTVEA